MNSIIPHDNFNFLNITLTNYHHTDNRRGYPLHYVARLLKGTAKIVSADKTIEIKTGDVFYIPKNLPYQSYWYGDEKGEIDFLSFGFAEAGTADFSVYDLQVIPVTDETVDKISHIPTNGVHTTCYALGLFYSVLADILPDMECTAVRKDEAAVQKIKQAIRRSPHSSLREIAAMCAVSEPYLYLLFKNAMGYTPNEYRQRVLCEMATELLVTTDKKIEDIAGILNFSSGSYFRKVLKKYTGKTPGEIRKNRVF